MQFCWDGVSEYGEGKVLFITTGARGDVEPYAAVCATAALSGIAHYTSCSIGYIITCALTLESPTTHEIQNLPSNDTTHPGRELLPARSTAQTLIFEWPMQA
eukprot:4868653-Amphidinium_carterae.1